MLSALLLSPVMVSAEEAYRLQAGDALRLVIAGLPGGDWTAQIGLDGQAGFPHLGALPAAGATLADLRAALALRLASSVAITVTADGRLQQIPLAGVGAHLEIAAYRPVFVTGDVPRAGELPFTPGLTVRAALARFGGLIDPLEHDPAGELTRWQAAYAQAVLDDAKSHAALWRIAAALARDPGLPVPAPEAEIPAPLLAPILEAEGARLAQNLAGLAAARHAQDRMLALSVARSRALDAKRMTYAQAVAQEEDDLARMQGLFERGAVALSRIAEMRRILLASTVRLLEVEDALAAEAARQARLDDTRRRLDADFDAEHLAQQAELVEAQLSAKARRHSAAERLLHLGQTLTVTAARVAAPEAGAQPPRIIVHRRDASGAVQQTMLDLDDPVQPGDILEIGPEIRPENQREDQPGRPAL
ncbi:MAG: polysaccharide biosynthesis/export family protein [Pseudomonadota bacterium]